MLGHCTIYKCANGIIYYTCTLLVKCFFFYHQLYGEYREHPGGSQRREATRLLTERQRKKHSGHHHHSHHGHHGRSLSRSRHRTHHHLELEIGSHDRQEQEEAHTSSFKKRRSYSKCRGQGACRGLAVAVWPYRDLIRR